MIMASQQTPWSPQLLDTLALVSRQELRELSPETLRGLDETLRKLQSSVSHQLGETRPINRLPREILLRIFQDVRSQEAAPLPPMHGYYIDFPLTTNIGPPLPPDTRSLISVTHVCHRWRDTALSSPTLWADVVATSASAARAFVSRARNLPMRVHVTVTGSKLSRFQRKALQYLLPHIRGLVLRLRYRAEIQLFQPILSKLATSLVHLGIVVRSEDPYGQGPWTPRFRDGYHLFGQEVSSLKSLAIVSPEELIPNGHFPHLCELTIHQPHFSGPSSTPQALARFLSHTPGVERLLLVSPIMSTVLPLIGHDLRLPRLRIIRVHVPRHREASTFIDSQATRLFSGPEALSGSMGDVGSYGYTIRGRSRELGATGCVVELVSHALSGSSLFWPISPYPAVYSPPSSPWFAHGVKSLRITRGSFAPTHRPLQLCPHHPKYTK
ncbi:hypothetical protein C8Q73DRAFT_494212 [Cubamyces lactineus]|nr:hypothetical protein C8Q73DRAFT_494212 [Cubamyces lactineus]